MEKEIWKDVVGYEGLYLVSSYGNVKAHAKTDDKGACREERLLKPYKTPGGYYRVGLVKNGTRKHYLVHRLVASAFIKNTDNLPFINHKDENKLNNFVFINPDGSVNPEKSNLEWCDMLYNIRYGTAIERKAKTQINGKNSKKIAQYDLNNQLIRVWPSAAEYERQTGKRRSAISMCVNGKRNIAYGYKWSYCTLNTTNS